MTGAALGDSFTLLTISERAGGRARLRRPRARRPRAPRHPRRHRRALRDRAGGCDAGDRLPGRPAGRGRHRRGRQPRHRRPGAGRHRGRRPRPAQRAGRRRHLLDRVGGRGGRRGAGRGGGPGAGHRRAGRDRRPRGRRGPHPDAEPAGPLDGRRGPGAPGRRPGPSAGAARARGPGAGAGRGGHGRRGGPGDPAVRHLPDRVRAQDRARAGRPGRRARAGARRPRLRRPPPDPGRRPAGLGPDGHRSRGADHGRPSGQLVAEATGRHRRAVRLRARRSHRFGAGAAGRSGGGGGPRRRRAHVRGEPRSADRRPRSLRGALRPRGRRRRRGAARGLGGGARGEPVGGRTGAVHGDHRAGGERRPAASSASRCARATWSPR